MKRFTQYGLFSSLLLASQLVLAAFSIPDYEKYTMDNGLDVYLMRQDEVPLVDVLVAVKAGSVQDGAQYGLAEFTAEALKFGAAGKSKIQLEDEIAFYGADFGGGAGTEVTTLSMSYAKKDGDVMLPLLADMLLRPDFDQAEIDKYQKRLGALLKQNRESPRAMMGDLLNHLYYGNHPYANPASGNEKTVAAMTRDDIKGFYRDYFKPDNAAIIVVGDIEPKAMKAKLTKYFSTWSGKAKAKQAVATVDVPKTARVLLVNKGDAKETRFVIGGPGIALGDENEVPLSVINTILGGRFTSWLNDELRVNSGLTYGARSRFDKESKAGLFRISTFTKTETTFEALDLALKTYQRLWEQGIDQKTLDSAKAYVKGLFPPRFETSSQLASLLGSMWAFDLGDEMINDFEAKVGALDVALANQLAKKQFPRDKLQFVLIGKADDIREKAKQYGEVIEVDIKDFYH
ncbi:M16 family metallopeptidase [Pseudoteredinibacter isoporae]|uniref:M16 family metallopeptidase n=1 Tax=Pseudoteredinibacter isoporae TaxID=570281 RepID=UPI0031071378